MVFFVHHSKFPDYRVDAPSINAFKNRLVKDTEKYKFRLEIPSTMSNPVEV
jgi:hypothetical protein